MPAVLPAIIGGTGLANFPEFEVTEQVVAETHWGLPSGPVCIGQLAGQPALFLSRHGINADIPPHRVNYRANIAALVELGATHVFAYNAVGGIDSAMPAGSLVVPQQIIDYTWGREHTYSDGGAAELCHVDFSMPYDESLRNILLTAAKKCGHDIVGYGVYGATQGPRLESAAEILRLEGDGCHLVGMTGMPEAALAREKALPYACLALVVNPAAGKSTQHITLTDIRRVMASSLPKVHAVLAEACAGVRYSAAAQ